MPPDTTPSLYLSTSRPEPPDPALEKQVEALPAASGAYSLASTPTLMSPKPTYVYPLSLPPAKPIKARSPSTGQSKLAASLGGLFGTSASRRSSRAGLDDASVVDTAGPSDTRSGETTSDRSARSPSTSSSTRGSPKPGRSLPAFLRTRRSSSTTSVPEQLPAAATPTTSVPSSPPEARDARIERAGSGSLNRLADWANRSVNLLSASSSPEPSPGLGLGLEAGTALFPSMINGAAASRGPAPGVAKRSLSPLSAAQVTAESGPSVPETHPSGGHSTTSPVEALQSFTDVYASSSDATAGSPFLATASTSTLPALPTRPSLSPRSTFNLQQVPVRNMSTPIPPPQAAFPFAMSTLASEGTTSTPSRMRTLPRLLSNAAYRVDNTGTGFNTVAESESAGVAGLETETETETETDTEAERSSSGSDDDDEDQSTPPDVIQSSAPMSSQPSSRSSTNSQYRRPSTAPARAAHPTAPGNWISFGLVTPHTNVSSQDELTPRIGRHPPLATTSYFDLPLQAAAARTPTAGGPLMTPFLPMSVGQEVRGLRPVRSDDVGADLGRRITLGETQVANKGKGKAVGGEMNAPEASGGLYRHRSKSAVNLQSPTFSSSDEDETNSGDVDVAAAEAQRIAEFHAIWQSPGGPMTPAPAFFASPTLSTMSPVVGTVPTSPASPASPASPVVNGKRPAAVPRPTTANRANRPRSMYELHAAPPVYHIVYARPGHAQIVLPREEEGAEGLPSYTCSVHIEGYYPRKLEFTAPSVQSRDRAWKRQYFVLHGTSIKIFKHDLKTHPIPGEEDWSVVSADITGGNGTQSVHFHEGEYGAVIPPGETGSGPGSPAPSGFIHDVKGKAKSHLPLQGSHYGNSVVKEYSLQNAESGLAADYLKRKHVVRVRAEGEQFLLQAQDDRGVIDLIEALQAATNVSLDLDARPLPKFITLPRRRRRRRAPSAAGASAATASGAPTDESAAATARDESRLHAMLTEEQNVYAASGNQASVM